MAKLLAGKAHKMPSSLIRKEREETAFRTLTPVQKQESKKRTRSACGQSCERIRSPLKTPSHFYILSLLEVS